MKPADLRASRSEDGSVVTLVLDGPPANVVGIGTAESLARAAAEAGADPRTRLVVLTGAGEHFSYGASVEDHLPDRAPRMLAAMSGAIRALLALDVPALAAVRGRCLGGGLELALACGMAWGEEGCVLGAPEVRLGVIAPFATALLEDAIPRGAFEEMLLTGAEVDAARASSLGLLGRVVPRGALASAVESFAAETLAPLSLRGLRAATRAARAERRRAIGERIARLERLYADELLRPGAEETEGLRAFLEKRAPRWEEPL